jgi:hypothetical protein
MNAGDHTGILARPLYLREMRPVGVGLGFKNEKKKPLGVPLQ